jgi:hypothetical protein
MDIHRVTISSAWRLAYGLGLDPKPASAFETDGDAHMHCVELLVDHGYSEPYPLEDYKVVIVKCFPSEAIALKETKQYSKKKRYLRFWHYSTLPTLKANRSDTELLFRLLNDGCGGRYTDNWESDNYADCNGIK